MTRCCKFVALALMLVMGTLPMLASACPSCLAKAVSANAAPAMHHCCPMNAEDAGLSPAAETNNSPLCCRVAPANPVRAFNLQMPAASAELALQPANEPVNAVPATAHARCDYHRPLPDSSHNQSHLCTFLI